jgi:hypothetical protein
MNVTLGFDGFGGVGLATRPSRDAPEIAPTPVRLPPYVRSCGWESLERAAEQTGHRAPAGRSTGDLATPCFRNVYLPDVPRRGIRVPESVQDPWMFEQRRTRCSVLQFVKGGQ